MFKKLSTDVLINVLRWVIFYHLQPFSVSIHKQLYVKIGDQPACMINLFHFVFQLNKNKNFNFET